MCVWVCACVFNILLVYWGIITYNKIHPFLDIVTNFDECIQWCNLPPAKNPESNSIIPQNSFLVNPLSPPPFLAAIDLFSDPVVPPLSERPMKRIRQYWPLESGFCHFAQFMLLPRSVVHSSMFCFYTWRNRGPGNFPGDPVAQTLLSQCRRPRFTPWSGN